MNKIQSTLERHSAKFENITLRTLNAFAVDIMSIPSAEDLFWYVARNVVGKLGFIDCVIYEANTSETELRQVAALGEKNPFGRNIINPLIIPFGQGITGRVAASREAIIIDDLMLDDGYIADTEPARSEICVPMVFSNRLMGVIDSEHPDPQAFGASELEILTTVAAMASAKLELLAEGERSNQRYYDLTLSHEQLTREITNRKALEAKLFEAQKQRAIGRLTGGVAHDFNNLLTIILGNLEIAQDIAKDLPEDVTECIDAARLASDRAAKLIHNMLMFSQQSYLRPEEVDLGEVVETTRELSRAKLGAGVEVQADICGHVQPIMADKAATENALLNLVLNANDAISGPGQIDIAAENVSFSLLDLQRNHIDLLPGNYVKVTVTDTGQGIRSDQITQIFDPFYTTKGSEMGRGLGLSTVMGFMQQTGGQVTVESSVGFGTCFTLFFPQN